MNFCLFTSEDIREFLSGPVPEEMTWYEKRIYAVETLYKKAIVLWYTAIVAYGSGIEITGSISGFF